MEARPSTTSPGTMAEPSISLFRVDHADAEAGQVVVARGVEVGQDGRLAAQQRAVRLDAAGGDALDELLQQRGVVLGHGHVVEEEQRLGPATQRVVDAHRHQVDAHRVV